MLSNQQFASQECTTSFFSVTVVTLAQNCLLNYLLVFELPNLQTNFMIFQTYFRLTMVRNFKANNPSFFIFVRISCKQ